VSISKRLIAPASFALAAAVLSSSAVRAAGPAEHQIELYDAGKWVLSIVQRTVPVGEKTEIQVIVQGPKTAAGVAAVMRTDGQLAFSGGSNRPEWWTALVKANGGRGTITPYTHTLAKRALLDLLVSGVATSHLITVAYVDPDNPWGPCPGPDDAPICQGEPVIVTDLCKWDVDQCSGGPIPWASAPTAASQPPACALCAPDPAADPSGCAFCGADPDGDPAVRARGGAFVVLARDPGAQSGVTRLAMDRSGSFQRIPAY